MIGAGLAGLACAAHLRSHGLHPVVFEKSRGVGGRLATRRVEGGKAFDHGTQYVTGRSPGFAGFLREAVATGAAERWHPSGIDRSSHAAEDWFVGVPGMSALAGAFTRGIEIRRGTRVTAVVRHGQAWRLYDASSDVPSPFDVVVCTTPAPQAQALLKETEEVGAHLADVSIAPCWALMVAFSARLETGFDVRRSKSQDLAWICRNSSKPYRHSERDCWVVHASPAWSSAHLELDRDHIAAKMIELFDRTVDGHLPATEHAVAHRWRYALTTVPARRPYLSTIDRSLFVGGDWCLGSRTEYAFESGRAIADAVIRDEENPRWTAST